MNKSSTHKPVIMKKWLFQKLLIKILSNWLLILIFATVSFSAAILINRYTNKIFRTKVDVVKGNPASENDGAAFLFGDPYQTGRLNTRYEKAFITSLPMLEKMIRNLDLQVSYYSEGRIKRSERFGSAPVKLNFSESSRRIPFNVLITINPASDGSFSLSCEDDYWVKAFAGKKFEFGQASMAGGFVFDLAKTGSFENADWIFMISPMESLAKSLQQSIQVSEVRDGYYGGQGNVSMLELSMQSSLPNKDRIILDQLVKEMKSGDVIQKIESSQKTIGFIETQLTQITDSMQLIATKMRSLKLSNKKLSAGSSAVFDRINTLEEQKAGLMMVNRYCDYLEQDIRDTASGEFLAPSTFGIDNNIMGGLVTQYINLKLEGQGMKALDLKSNVFMRERRLHDTKLRDVRSMILESIESTRSANKLKIKGFGDEVNLLLGSARSVMSEEIVYADYDRLYDLNEKVFTMLMNKKAEAGISQSSIISDYRVMESAETVYPPLRPQSRKNIMTSLFLGLFIPVAFLFLRILKQNPLLSLTELEDLIDLPVAGVIGFSPENKTVIDSPQSLISENFRSLRSNLRFVNHEKENTIFVVTSSVSDEGKSFVSVNLSAVLALQGKKVALVGADMRKPTLHSYFSRTEKNGLSYYLSGNSTFEEIIRPSGLENLDIIHSGPVPPNPAELLSGKHMYELISLLKARYEIIFFDTPPIGLISDASELFQIADSILLVTRQQKTPINTLQHVDHFMDPKNLSKTYVIFNGVKKGVGSGYYGYGYGYGYGEYS